jgi:hypothetical protein
MSSAILPTHHQPSFDQDKDMSTCNNLHPPMYDIFCSGCSGRVQYMYLSWLELGLE